MVNHVLHEILHPRSIAVVGASVSGPGWRFLLPLLRRGFEGKLYPVNPKYQEIGGLKCYASVAEIPDTVDYIISVVPAPLVPNLIRDAATKGTKAIHLFTARFSETGRPQAAQMEREMLGLAKQYGIRIIGPNCMGVYYPAWGISFEEDFPLEPGKVAFISQSGNLAGEVVRSAGLRGIRFSKVISYGNAIDLNECDYLEYLLQDPETAVILMYMEGVKDGRRFVSVLRQATEVKPVVILKGGRGEAGARATSSHTASLAGSVEIWEAALEQTNAIGVDSIEELVDMAVTFNSLPPLKGKRVGVTGGAGGASVLAADQCEMAGLEVVPLSPEFREQLKSRGISVWDWLSNPADLSIREDESLTVKVILELMSQDPNFDLLILMLHVHRHGDQPEMTLDDFLKQHQLEGFETVATKPLLAVVPERSFGIEEWDSVEWKLACELRSRLISSGIPFYPTVYRAALAARRAADYYARLNGR